MFKGLSNADYTSQIHPRLIHLIHVLNSMHYTQTLPKTEPLLDYI